MRTESFVSATDLHGDRQDSSAVKGFLAFVEAYKPKVKVFQGDIWDFRAIREGASKDEKRHSMREDFYAGLTFLKQYRPNVITLGNHDARLFDLVEKEGVVKSGPLTDLAIGFIDEFNTLVKKLGITVLPYDKRRGVWKYNGLKFLHGFNNGENAAAETARVYGNSLIGHGHAISSATEPGHDGPRNCQMIGALCRLDMSYNRAQTGTLKQAHGWAYGAFLPHNKFEVFQARIQNNQVVYAERLSVLKIA